MKDEIEVGEYVRTKSGLIGKFQNIEEDMMEIYKSILKNLVMNMKILNNFIMI